MAVRIQCKRAYDDEDPDDGYRVLVDRLWPRGLSKDQLRLDAWYKDLAPSGTLRKWFGHQVDRWPEFGERYRAELQTPEQRERIRDLLNTADQGHITLLYGAKDTEHNQAVILAEEIAHAIASKGDGK